MVSEIPQTMRASQWTSISGSLENSLKFNKNAPLPSGAASLTKDQTLVHVSYSALNPVDYKLPELPIVGRFAIKKPASPCMDYSGRVIATGRSDLMPGQLVFGKLEPPQFGALAEYIVVGREGTVPLPEGVKLLDAGCVGVAGLTAYQCVVPNIKKGDKVFINGGSGGTGSFGIQIAKAMDCYVATSCSGPNVDLCRSIGADEVIDYKSEDIIQTLKRKGMQFDLIVDNVGSPELYWQSHHYLKPSGKVVTVGATPGVGVVIDLMKIFLWPSFLGGGQRRFQFLTVVVNAKHYAHIADLMASGKVKPVVDEIYDLEDASKAFQKLKSGGFKGKLVVKVAGEEV